MSASVLPVAGSNVSQPAVRSELGLPADDPSRLLTESPDLSVTGMPWQSGVGIVAAAAVAGAARAAASSAVTINRDMCAQTLAPARSCGRPPAGPTRSSCQQLL